MCFCLLYRSRVIPDLIQHIVCVSMEEAVAFVMYVALQGVDESSFTFVVGRKLFLFTLCVCAYARGEHGRIRAVLYVALSRLRWFFSLNVRESHTSDGVVRNLITRTHQHFHGQ